METVTQGRMPPYVSYKTWLKMLEGLKIFVPDKIDGSYYRDLLFSGSSAKKLRTTLLFLGLINEDNDPTASLHRLAKVLQGTSQEDRSEVIRDIVQNAYSFLFVEDFNLVRATSGQLSDRFEKHGIKGNSQRQCISFFLHIAHAAEIELSPHLSTRSRVGIGRKSDLLKSRESKRKKLSTRQSKNTQLRGDEGFDWSKLHPAILALLKDLAERGASWDAEEKANFKKAFEAVFDIAYPNDRHGSK